MDAGCTYMSWQVSMGKTTCRPSGKGLAEIEWYAPVSWVDRLLRCHSSTLRHWDSTQSHSEALWTCEARRTPGWLRTMQLKARKAAMTRGGVGLELGPDGLIAEHVTSIEATQDDKNQMWS